jgi:adenine-specific DNA-methyltransferase
MMSHLTSTFRTHGTERVGTLSNRQLATFGKPDEGNQALQVVPASYSLGQRRYLGGKSKLLDAIYDLSTEILGDAPGSVFDVFAGTGVVAERFARSGSKVIANDLLFHNYVSLQAFLGKGKVSADSLCEKMSYLQRVKGSKNYFSENFGGTFFSIENAKKIGAMREEIEKISESERERFCLISSLIYATDKIANTVGHYDAFHRAQDNTNPVALRMPSIFSETSKNVILNGDSNSLASDYFADIVYLDPPYNSRQYSDAYHLLENLAQWEKPEVYGVAKKMDRTHIKSRFCGKGAPLAFESLIDSVDGKVIIVSFNNTGESRNARSNSTLTDEQILKPLKARGKVKTVDIEFGAFTTGKTKDRKGHMERLFVCEVSN